MSPTFDSLVDELRRRPTEEKAELKFLLERELIAARRSEILANHAESQKEFRSGNLRFSTSLKELKKALAAK
jgi:hypothetical protein